MSSPLSSLKKGRKTPLGISNGIGKRSMPFRVPDYSTDERQLLDEIHGHLSTANSYESPNQSSVITPHPHVNQLQASNASPKESFSSFGSTNGNYKRSNPTESIYMSKGKRQDHVPSDLELLSSMMQKIAKLEKLNLHYSKEIIEKDKRIEVLEEKNKLIEKNLRFDESKKPPLIAELEAKCMELKQQVYEMETFLADYGMIWVGEKSNSNSYKYLDEDIETSHPSTSNSIWQTNSPRIGEDFVPCYDLIIQNIKDLNALAGDGEAKVVNTSNGAKLQTTTSIPLTLYKNGIMMFSGPFRSFEEVSTQRCMKDIMDGYFPSELQSRYPDGIPINITDKRFVTFEDPCQLEKFPGVGNLLGGEQQPSNLIDTRLKMPSPSMSSVFSPAFSNSESGVPRTEVSRERPGPKLTVEQFVNRLPKTVIRNGNIINVRESIAEQLTDGYSSTSSTELVETEVVHEMQKRMSMSETNRPPSARNITTLRVKTEEGDKTLLIKMKFRETIRDLRKYINRQRPHQDQNYEIFSTFPSKVYSEDFSTLEECGLTPNANLSLRFVKNQ